MENITKIWEVFKTLPMWIKIIVAITISIVTIFLSTQCTSLVKTTQTLFRNGDTIRMEYVQQGRIKK